jgi:hypothetical protein
MEKFEILLYSVPEGKATIEVFFEDETFWLSQKKMAELFNVEVNTINYHLKEIFNTSELDEKATIRNFRIVQPEGRRQVEREVAFYNLDAIIAVGYRVNSIEATRFRIWATRALREFIIKGFVLDDERLKQGKSFGRDYFEELLERIREIRASERRFYQKITDIYKLHWAVTGQTAAEIIHTRVDASKPNMGLTTWKHAPDGKILKTDVSIAKNYLEEKEINELNRVVAMYLDYAENQAQRNIPMSMVDWVQKLDAFLQFNDYNTLKNAGTISHDIAKKLAGEQYDQYRIVQDRRFESDFDKLAKKPPESDENEKPE